MLTAKEFLLQECSNIQNSLDEVLTHKYGGTKSKDFYEECLFRVETVKDKIEQTSLDSFPELQEFSRSLSHLSRLIARTERSRLGEFSWIFADEFERIAKSVCSGTKDGGDAYDDPPIFAISAGGGLASYDIELEPELVQFQTKHRIFSVQFPRTLKHHVLLHPILAHELGHAANEVPSMQAELTSEVLAHLETGPLQSTETFSAWFLEWAASSPGASEFEENEINEEIIDAWCEELLCDLFGLVTFGPSFVAAHQSLLVAVDPRLSDIGLEHPPPYARFVMLGQAVKYLAWNSENSSFSAPVSRAINSFWKRISDRASAAPDWAKFYEDEAIEEAVDGLLEVLKPLGNSLYSSPAPSLINKIVKQLGNIVPPCGYSYQRSDITHDEIDFRWILYGGWVSWVGREHIHKTHTEIDFFTTNKLCHLGMIHQRAISMDDAGAGAGAGAA